MEIVLLALLQVRLGDVEPDVERRELLLQELEHGVGVVGEIVDGKRDRLFRLPDRDVDDVPDAISGVHHRHRRGVPRQEPFTAHAFEALLGAGRFSSANFGDFEAHDDRADVSKQF